MKIISSDQLTMEEYPAFVNHMVKYTESSLGITFIALSDGTRRAILARLAKGDALVSELAAPFDISLPAVSKHLSVLERAGLIHREKEGRIRRCRLEANPLKEAAHWIQFYRRFWEARLDSLEEDLDNISSDEEEENNG